MPVPDDDGGNPEIISEPVICWALTADGSVWPVGSDLELPFDGMKWGLRRRGDSEAFLPAVRTSGHESDWIAAYNNERVSQKAQDFADAIEAGREDAS
jgi:hypothetical protein